MFHYSGESVLKELVSTFTGRGKCPGFSAHSNESLPEPDINPCGADETHVRVVRQGGLAAGLRPFRLHSWVPVTTYFPEETVLMASLHTVFSHTFSSPCLCGRKGVDGLEAPSTVGQHLFEI